jgi:hypothetical protein
MTSERKIPLGGGAITQAIIPGSDQQRYSFRKAS